MNYTLQHYLDKTRKELREIAKQHKIQWAKDKWQLAWNIHKGINRNGQTNSIRIN